MDPVDSCITVWRDGTWKVWDEGDALYARQDFDWLLDFPLQQAIEDAQDGGTDALFGLSAELLMRQE